LRRSLTFAIALASLLVGAAQAQQSTLRFPIRAWPDGVIVGTTAVAALLPVVWPSSFAHATCTPAPCDQSRLWTIDRGAVGPVNQTANLASYVTSAAETGLGLLFIGASRRGEGRAAFLEDAAVITQAVSVTAAATMALKVLLHRPRPLMFVPGQGGITIDDGRGFPSSHTSISFAVASAYASILHRRGLASSHAAQIGVLFGTAAVTGVLRVVAHEHFPSDVVAGAALGLVVGWIIPKLHATQP
jgi:membrane-associated phospholipid phosphatase